MFTSENLGIVLVKTSLDAEICKTKQITPRVIEREVHYWIGIRGCEWEENWAAGFPSWALTASSPWELLRTAGLWSRQRGVLWMCCILQGIERRCFILQMEWTWRTAQLAAMAHLTDGNLLYLANCISPDCIPISGRWKVLFCMIKSHGHCACLMILPQLVPVLQWIRHVHLWY